MSNEVCRLTTYLKLLRALWDYREVMRALDQRCASLRAEAHKLALGSASGADIELRDLRKLEDRLHGLSEAASRRKRVYRSLLWLAVRGLPKAVFRARGKLSYPPIGACFLLDLLLVKADRDAIPGDLSEAFAADLSKYGLRPARLLFWTRALGVVAWRNPVSRWALVFGFGRLIDWVLRKLG
jgi:hypothetical protein